RFKPDKEEDNKYINAELTKDSTPRKERAELWYNNNNDNKTVQEEGDLFKPLLDTIVTKYQKHFHMKDLLTIRLSNLFGSLQSRSIEPDKNYSHNGADRVLSNCI
ncbi:42866_t:CDS:2, partial [Gigaspora margarita]